MLWSSKVKLPLVREYVVLSNIRAGRESHSARPFGRLWLGSTASGFFQRMSGKLYALSKPVRVFDELGA